MQIDPDLELPASEQIEAAKADQPTTANICSCNEEGEIYLGEVSLAAQPSKELL